ncbi:amidohydrolase [Sphingorhabdus lutea]|uniref:Amidohydrolase n=1 Tax=Sphingorhabdus lutea TaxID=1913578 RepID=A0A1L3JCR1_9SPHN|nr:amidohydrolase family protein [Sphingorhabdus lutea]APG62947.1 amidohydrolase [Sphingorhabdus lutea]
MKKFITLTAALLSLSATSAFAQSYAIIGGKLITGDGSAPIENGTVVIKDGKVIAAGSNIAIPADAQKIDATNKWVTPGIFAGFSRLGLTEISAVSGTNDENASKSKFSAALDVSDAISADRSPFGVNRASGVTRAAVAPSVGGNIFAGQGAIANLGEGQDPTSHKRVFQFVEMGERAASIAGGSRTASKTLFRSMLRQASDYANNRANFDESQLTVEDAKALLKVISGETMLLAHVESAADINQMIDLKKEYPAMKLVIVGASEGWRVADRLARENVPVIASALNDLPSSFEVLAATQSNVGRMENAGVKVAIGMIDDRDAHQLRYSAQYAGNLVALNKVPGATGVNWNTAFALISSRPAEILGQGGKLGVLKNGAAADVVIWNGDPLELSTNVEQLFIDGKKQSLENRQSKLRDRYANPVEGNLPKAYDR